MLTWTFRIAGVLLALFGGANVLAALIMTAEPGWLSVFLFVGGALAMAAGVFHATARVVD